MHIKLTAALSKLFLPVLLLIITGESIGQTVPVSIKVSNQKKEPVAFASVSVSNRLDSLQVFTKAADSSGKVIFNLAKGQYAITISAVNYQPFEKGVTVSGNQPSFNFVLESAGKTMEGVVVTSRKPLIRQEDDKTIVDPEPIAATSTSGYEILEKTPGLFVDQDGNIYISSMTPASVQINGRDMKMSAEDMATLLKNLPPNSIAKIEILRTPSAKYDASGGGGIVNVVLKKGVKLGMTGSVSGGIQQGVYGNQFLGFNLNNNDGKRSSNLNLSVGNRNNYEQIKTDRFYAPDTALNQDAYTKYHSKSMYGSYGVTWQFGKKWELTYDGDLNYNKYDNRSDNRNSISKVSTSQLLSNSLNTVSNEGYNLSLGSGIETKYKIDTLGSEWTNDIYFTHSIGRSDQGFNNGYTVPSIAASGGDGSADNDRNYFTGRSDLKLKMKKKFTFEGGAQVTINSFRNYTNYFTEKAGVRTKDLARTNTFQSNTNINSLYLQGSKTLGKDFIIKFGTRLENTNIKGKQIIPGDTTFSIHRTDLFPYVYLSKKLIRISGFDLRGYIVYRRTIARPSYTQLNPFRRYVDEFLTETGNPALRPQFTNNYEFNISADETPILAVGINDTKDIFTNVVYQSDTSRSQAFRTFDNIGKNKEWYFRGMGAIPPGGKYFFVLGAQYNHNFYQGLYENKPLSFKKGTWTLFTYHALKFDKRSTLTMNGFVRFKGQQQFYELSTFGSLSSSINRRFLKDKLTVTMSVNDMFRTNKNEFTLQQGSVNASGFRQGDTRRFGLNLRYNFGIRKKEENNEVINADTPPN
jgi:iron complex outermembrane recepter protein